MKLVLFGGGGIRTPLFVRSMISRMIHGGPEISELFLYDVNPDRLKLMTSIARWMVTHSGLKLKVSAFINPQEAASDVQIAVVSIRPGFEKARIIDEKTALGLGLIGQETVGAGGFAMACRSITEVLQIAELLDKYSKKCLLINFTNPSGIVTQALRNAGYTNAFGICDSSDVPIREAAAFLGIPLQRLRAQVFGLNHMSAAYSIKDDDREILQSLLGSDRFMEKHMGIFDKEILRKLHILPNEYLFYYLHPDRALAGMLAEKKTRGESVAEASAAFFSQAKAEDPEGAVNFHSKLIEKRVSTYMNYAWEGHDKPPIIEIDEGYAGVALNLMQGLTSEKPIQMILNIPVHTAPGVKPDDVVETSCEVSKNGIIPLDAQNLKIPEKLLHLIIQVKQFERLTCQAVVERNREKAIEALSCHPLIGKGKAVTLLEDYAKAHGGILREIAG